MPKNITKENYEVIAINPDILKFQTKEELKKLHEFTNHINKLGAFVALNLIRISLELLESSYGYKLIFKYEGIHNRECEFPSQKYAKTLEKLTILIQEEHDYIIIQEYEKDCNYIIEFE